MKNRSIINWSIDALLFISFILAFFLDLTGLSFHEWLGAGVALLAGYHLLLHWAWVKSVTKRFFGKTSSQARRYYVLDGTILVGFIMFSVTGLVISTWFKLPLTNYITWVDVHVYSSILTLALVVLKIALHWRWTVYMAKKIFTFEVTTPGQSLKPQTVTTSGKMTRRGFLSLMSVVGFSSLLAVNNVLDAEASPGEVNANSQPEPDQVVIDRYHAPVPAVQIVEVQSTDAPQAEPTATQQPTEVVKTTCVIRCGKNCSYPGKCRKYVNANNNNLCDLAECN